MQIYIYIYILQTKTYFCYFNIIFEMSRRVILFVFDILNTKYLAFKTPNVSTLILGWLGFFIFYVKKKIVFVKFLSWLIASWDRLIKREGPMGSKFLEKWGWEYIYIYITIKKIFFFFLWARGAQLFFSFFSLGWGGGPPWPPLGPSLVWFDLD